MIHDNVTVGKNTEIMENANIGTQPFCYERISKIPLMWKRVKGEKGVKIGDDVTIHCNSIIVAGVESRTEIGNMVKIAQRVNIGHDCKVGKGTIINNYVSLCGYVIIGKGCIIGARTIIRERVKIGNNVVIGLGSIVMKDIPDNCVAYNITKDGETVYCRYVRKSRSDIKALIRRMFI